MAASLPCQHCEEPVVPATLDPALDPRDFTWTHLRSDGTPGSPYCDLSPPVAEPRQETAP